jgi:hypothetical protein
MAKGVLRRLSDATTAPASACAQSHRARRLTVFIFAESASISDPHLDNYQYLKFLMPENNADCGRAYEHMELDSQMPSFHSPHASRPPFALTTNMTKIL